MVNVLMAFDDTLVVIHDIMQEPNQEESMCCMCIHVRNTSYVYLLPDHTSGFLHVYDLLLPKANKVPAALSWRRRATSSGPEQGTA